MTAGDRPVLVWFRGPGERDGRGRDLYPCLRSRSIVLVLKRFRCLRLDVEDLTEDEWRDRTSDRLGFAWFDPAGRPVGDPLTGRRAGSVTVFSRRMERVWRASFVTPLKPWVSGMRKNVKRGERNRKSRVLTEWQIVRAEYGRRPHLVRAAKLRRRLAGLRKEKERIRRHQEAWEKSCRLRPEFRPVPEKPRPKPKLR